MQVADPGAQRGQRDGLDLVGRPPEPALRELPGVGQPLPVLLDPVERAAIPDLPLVIGPGADKQEPMYQRLLAAAPALKPRVAAATWVGNRRWDLRFDSGETLKLPEEGAAAALLDFARRDGANPLLGRGWLSFDMRDPAKMVVRKPHGATRQVADPGDAPAAATREQGMEG